MRLKDVVKEYLQLYFPNDFKDTCGSTEGLLQPCTFYALEQCPDDDYCHDCSECAKKFENIEIDLNKVEDCKLKIKNPTNLNVFNSLAKIFLTPFLDEELLYTASDLEDNKCLPKYFNKSHCDGSCEDCQNWWNERYEIPKELN